jgi:hypothetical protein
MFRSPRNAHWLQPLERIAATNTSAPNEVRLAASKRALLDVLHLNPYNFGHLVSISSFANLAVDS